MKTFAIHPTIQEYDSSKEFAAEVNLGKSDLILANERYL